MACDCNDNRRNSSLLDALCDNIDNLITVHTTGCSRVNGITGLLTQVNCDAIKMVTRCGCFGKVTVVPIDQIAAVTICNTSV